MKEGESKMKEYEMVRQEIADFIGLPAPDRYDLRFATAEANARHEGFRDAYEKFFVYKYNKDVKNMPNWNQVWESMGEDCDRLRFEIKAYKFDPMQDPDSSSVLLQLIYRTLLTTGLRDQQKESAYYTSIKQNRIPSDAMTSVQGILKDALKKVMNKNYVHKNVESLEISDRIQRIYGELQTLNGKQPYWTKLFNTVVVAKLDEEFYGFIDHNYPNMMEFMNRCFTIGNYCPVSAGFNTARSKYDYWDLTLMKIRKWYMTGDDSELSKLLQNDSSSSNMNKCKEWLNWFAADGETGENAWICFVDKLYMQDYVLDALNGNYEVKPFWQGHGWEKNSEENPGTPGTESLNTTKKMNDALIEISARVAARSVRILNALQKNLTNNE